MCVLCMVQGESEYIDEELELDWNVKVDMKWALCSGSYTFIFSSFWFILPKKCKTVRGRVVNSCSKIVIEIRKCSLQDIKCQESHYFTGKKVFCSWLKWKCVKAVRLIQSKRKVQQNFKSSTPFDKVTYYVGRSHHLKQHPRRKREVTLQHFHTSSSQTKNISMASPLQWHNPGGCS